MMDNETYELLARVRFDHPKFIEWLTGRLEKADLSIRKSRGKVEVRWAQGRAQELEDIIDQLTTAETNLRKANELASKREKR